MNPNEAVPSATSETSVAQRPEKSGVDIIRRTTAITGYLLLATSPLPLLFVLYRWVITDKTAPPPPSDEGTFAWFMMYYGLETFSLIGFGILAAVGLRLLGMAGRTAPRVIPTEDRQLLEPLVETANKDAIAQYVILSSLSGFTGTFQKIGFSGLPLATSMLTLLFSILAFVKPEFLEFAKLTLGAFIGSFVQRGGDAPKLPTISWKSE